MPHSLKTSKTISFFPAHHNFSLENVFRVSRKREDLKHSLQLPFQRTTINANSDKDADFTYLNTGSTSDTLTMPSRSPVMCSTGNGTLARALPRSEAMRIIPDITGRFENIHSCMTTPNGRKDGEEVITICNHSCFTPP